MRTLISAILCVAFMLMGAQNAHASDLVVQCGPLKVTYGTTMGFLGEGKGRMRARSLEAIAALVERTSAAPKGPEAWIAWDDLGKPWVHFRKGSRVESLMSADVLSEIGTTFVPFKPGRFVVPMGFTLWACPMVPR